MCILKARASVCTVGIFNIRPITRGEEVLEDEQAEKRLRNALLLNLLQEGEQFKHKAAQEPSRCT